MTKNFNLCPTYYSEGKVTGDINLEEYVFREYSSKADIMDQFKIFSSKKGFTAAHTQTVT